jgi:hypothetical protein
MTTNDSNHQDGAATSAEKTQFAFQLAAAAIWPHFQMKLVIQLYQGQPRLSAVSGGCLVRVREVAAIAANGVIVLVLSGCSSATAPSSVLSLIYLPTEANIPILEAGRISK